MGKNRCFKILMNEMIICLSGEQDVQISGLSTQISTFLIFTLESFAHSQGTIKLNVLKQCSTRVKSKVKLSAVCKRQREYM